jgi:hypothetical protein
VTCDVCSLSFPSAAVACSWNASVFSAYEVPPLPPHPSHPTPPPSPLPPSPPRCYRHSHQEAASPHRSHSQPLSTSTIALPKARFAFTNQNLLLLHPTPSTALDPPNDSFSLRDVCGGKVGGRSSSQVSVVCYCVTHIFKVFFLVNVASM